MNLSVSVDVNASIEQTWEAIVNFDECSSYISSIVSLSVLERPTDTLIGFKWKETRVMFGKEAEETMWITDYKENSFYQTRAENHGMIYISRLEVAAKDKGTKLTMSFNTAGTTFMSRLMSKCMGWMMNGMMKKAILVDLEDIKRYVEKNNLTGD